MKKPKETATKPGKIKSNWVLSALWDFGSTASKTTDVLGLDDAPEWVWNAWAQIGNTVVPGGFEPPEKWDAAYLGNLLGRLHGLGMMFAGEVPMGPETTAELQKLPQNGANKLPANQLKKIEKDLETALGAIQNAIPAATNAAMTVPHQERMAFQKALTKGMDIQPEALATSRTFRRHTRTFWVLALYWRYWVKCRSVHEVYRHLCNAIGEQKIGSFKTFETHVAKKIGMRFRGRGRPKTAK
jgi:hypothetical protein